MTEWLRWDPLIAILGMAVVTYALRAGGLLLADRLPQRGRWAYALERLPGAVLLSVAVPGAVAAGPAGWVGAAVTLAVMVVLRNVFLAIALGTAAVALIRWA